jgi:hypothetical protein
MIREEAVLIGKMNNYQLIVIFYQQIKKISVRIKDLNYRLQIDQLIDI